jgi:hypothetical protein
VRGRRAIIFRPADSLTGMNLHAKQSQMTNYRIVSVDDAGKVSSQRSFACANDDDAIVWARQLLDKTSVELWSGARFIARIEPEARAKT